MHNTNNRINLKNKLLSSILFFFFAVTAFALPGTSATNLQTTTGVSATASGATLSIAAPNKSVLTWQNFGSGADAIAAGDTINFALPSISSSVLNIVAGGARSTIDGTITSNGNVFLLNGSGVLIGNGARIETNSLCISTSDNAAFANYYFQQSGKLPSQDSLVLAAGSTQINSGSVITVTENISLYTKNLELGGAVINGNLRVNADGIVNLGSSGLTFVNGNIAVTNPTGLTTLGSSGNNLLFSNAITIDGGAVNQPINSSVSAKSLTIEAGTNNVSLARVTVPAIVANGNNVSVTFGAVVNPTFSSNATGNIAVVSPTSLAVNNLKNSTGTTSVLASGALTLGNIHVDSAAATTFTGSSVSDSRANSFVYGPVTFAATAGDVSLTKEGHSFGPVSVTATGNATITESAALNLNVVNAASLVAKSNEFIFQTPATGVLTTQSATITTAGNVTLNAVTNNIGNLTVSGANIAVTTSSAIALGNTDTGGTLTLGTSGAITQSADTKINVFGTTTLTTIDNAITLTNAGNRFGGLNFDTGLGGTILVTEDTTLNVSALRANTVTLKSLDSVITTGTNAVTANLVNVLAGKDFIPAANFRANNGLTVLASGTADLSLLSLSANLNNRMPSIIATAFKTPTP